VSVTPAFTGRPATTMVLTAWAEISSSQTLVDVGQLVKAVKPTPTSRNLAPEKSHGRGRWLCVPGSRRWRPLPPLSNRGIARSRPTDLNAGFLTTHLLCSKAKLDNQHVITRTAKRITVGDLRNLARLVPTQIVSLKRG